MMIVVLMTFASAQSTISTVSINLVSQNPQPATPGQFVDVVLQVQNTGTTEVKDFRIEFLPEFPFTIVGEALKTYPTVPFVRDSPLLVRYRVNVADNAPIGQIPFKVIYSMGPQGTIQKEFTIDIQSSDASVNVNAVLISPEEIVPGGQATISLVMENTATTTARDISVRLDMAGSYLTPIGSTSEKRVAILQGGNQEIVSYSVRADANAEPGSYKIPLRISFKDNKNREYTLNDTIGFLVGSQPDVTITTDYAQIFQGSGTGTIGIKIINKGFTDIKFVTVAINETGDFDVDSSAEYYIGNLDSDDFEVADFTLSVKNKNAERMSIPVTITFKDTNNKEYTMTSSMDVRVLPAQKSQTGWIVPVVVVLIVIGGIIWFVRRRK